MGDAAPVIPFDVIYATSSSGPKDAESVTELLENGEGWVSGEKCSYPQEIILQMKQKANLVKIQLVCHEKFISQKVEFFIGSARPGEDPSPENVQHAKFKRLGFVQFLEKIRSDDDKRERKTIFVDATGHFLQIKIHENYKSAAKNKYNQVGLTNIKLMGYVDGPPPKKKEEPYSLMNRSQSAKNLSSRPKTREISRSPAPQRSRTPYQGTTTALPSEPYSYNDGRKDPLIEVRTLQKILELKKRDDIAQNKVVHAKMCQTAIERLEKSEHEINHYNDLRKKAQIDGAPVGEIEKYRADAELVRESVMRAVHLELLLTPREIDSLKVEERPRTVPRNGYRKDANSPPRNQGSKKSPDHRHCDCNDSHHRHTHSRDRRPKSRSPNRKRRSSPEYITRTRRPRTPSLSPSPVRERAKSATPEPRKPQKDRAKSAPKEKKPEKAPKLNESTCPFCLEDNPEFKIPANLNKHYASICPVLTKCKYCKRVVEVRSLNDHYVNRCPSLKIKMVECPVCLQACDEQELKTHEMEGNKVCPGEAERGKTYCSLCALSVSESESGWRAHLMGNGSGTCEKNNRKGLTGVPPGSSSSSRKSTTGLPAENSDFTHNRKPSNVALAGDTASSGNTDSTGANRKKKHKKTLNKV